MTTGLDGQTPTGRMIAADAETNVSATEPSGAGHLPGSHHLYFGALLLVAAACLTDTWVVATSPEPAGGFKVKERETALGCFSVHVRTNWQHKQATHEVMSYEACASASNVLDDGHHRIAARRAGVLGIFLAWVLASTLLLHALVLWLARRPADPGGRQLHQARRAAHITLACALLIALCLATPKFVLMLGEARAGWYAKRGIFVPTVTWGVSTWLLLAAVLLRRPGR